MSDLINYNAESMKAMRLITDLMPASQRKEVELLLQHGLSLKLSTIVGEQPDVQLSLVNDMGQETLLYSLVGRIGETLQ